MSFGEILTSLRKARGLSQEQLAEHLDLTRQTISKWELDQSTPDLQYVLELSQFFEVSTDYLIKGADCEPMSGEIADNHPPEQLCCTCTVSSQRIAFKWRMIFGTVIAGVSLMGIIAFVIMSSMHSWTALINGVAFRGLLGYLIGTKTWWFFALLVETFFAGACLSILSLLKHRRSSKKCPK